MSTHFVLVPGHWLGGWAWDGVAVELRAAGHEVTAVTLPGLHPTDPDRSRIGWVDQVDALAKIVAATDPPVVLVAHSGAGLIASGVLDRDPGAVSRVIYVDSGPAADGRPFDPEAGPDVTEIPLPDFADLEAGGASLAGLSEADLAEFRARAVPIPGRVATDVVHLSNPARRSVPTTLVACSIPGTQVQELAEAGHPMFAEVATLADLSYVDVPTGHWPMFSRPLDLAHALVAAVSPPGGSITSSM